MTPSNPEEGGIVPGAEIDPVVPGPEDLASTPRQWALARWWTPVWRESSHRRVLAAIFTVGALSVAARLAMAARDITLAREFGTSNALDAFLQAYLLPLFATTIVSGALPSALVPVYIHVREHQGLERARRLASSALLLNAVTQLVVALALGLASPLAVHVIGSGFGPSKLALTHSLLLVVLPIVVLTGLNTVWAAVLNAHERFALAAIVPALTPMVVVLTVLLGPRSWGAYGIAAGTLAGAVVEGIPLYLGLLRRGLTTIPRWYGFDEHLRSVVRQFGPAMAGSLVMSSAVVVDGAMVASLGAGSVSALNYGSKAASFIVGASSLAIGTALLPHFSTMTAQRDWAGLRRSVKTYVTLIFVASVPLTAILVLASRPLVALVFQHGAFRAADTRLVARVQALSLLQMPFYLAGGVAVRVLHALQRNKVILAIAGVIVVVNATTDYLFMRWLGAPGIALATSLDFVCSSAILFWIVARELRRIERTVRAGSRGE